MARENSVYEAAKNQGRLWTPDKSIFSAWYDASDPSTVTLGTGVSAWADKTSNSLNLSQATSSRQPGYVANGLNGRPAVFFDGSNDFFSTGQTTGNFLSATNYTVFVVASVLSVSTDSATQTSNDAFFGDETGYVSMYLRSSGIVGHWTGADSATTSFQINTPAVFQCEWTNRGGGNTYVRINGGTAASRASGALSMSWNFEIGRQNGNDAYNFNGFISELMFLKRDMSDVTSTGAPEGKVSTRKQIEGYLAWKWGVSLKSSEHPFLLSPPMTGT